MTTKANPKDQNLSGKDEALLKSAYTAIDAKKYKKAVTYIDDFLKQFPTNAEGVTTKGLLVAYTNSMTNTAAREEAVALVKRGASFNLKSFEVWYFQGLMFKHFKQYGDAMKAFTQAAKLRPDHRAVTRDLAFMQAQSGNWEAYIETRRRWLQDGSNGEELRALWGGFAVANQLAGRLDIALRSMDVCDKMLRQGALMEGHNDDALKHPVEDTERFLYVASLHVEKGDHASAIEVLTTHRAAIRDRVECSAMLGTSYLALGERSRAEEVYRELQSYNPDNYLYHEGLMCALGLEHDARDALTGVEGTSQLPFYDALVQLYIELAVQYPKCNAIARLPLNFLVGDQFVAAASKYLRERLSKGIPSLFEDVAELYLDPFKAQALRGIMNGFVEQQTAANRFTAEESENTTSPSAALWALTFQAKEHDYYCETERALATIDRAMAHTPTSIDLYVTKANIYRNAGNEELALLWADKARTLDTADRFVNNMAARFAMEAGRPQLAEHMLRLFIKQGDMHKYLYSQQCSWFHAAMGKCYLQMRQHAQAAKNLLSVDDHFEGYVDSLYDYHLYCMRKGVLRTYANMCRKVRTIKDHKLYVPAILNMIYLYADLNQRLQTEQKVFAHKVVKGTKVTVEQYLAMKMDAADEPNILARAKQMQQDKEVLLTASHDAVEQQYHSTPMWAERTLLLEARGANIDEEERFCYGRQHPDADFFGWTNVASGVNFCKEALRFAHNTVNTDQPVAAALFTLVDAALMNGRVLLAAKCLHRAIGSLKAFDFSEATRDDLLASRAQICGMPWFQLDAVNDRTRLALLPLLFDAQKHVAKMAISSVPVEGVVATNIDILKAEGSLYADLKGATAAFVASQPATFAGRAVGAIGAVKGWVAAKHNGADIDLAAVVSQYLDFAAMGTPIANDRILLRIIAHLISIIDGSLIAAYSPLDGVSITKEDVTHAVDMSAVSVKLTAFAAEHFPLDISHYSSDDLALLRKQTEISVEYVPSEEADKLQKQNAQN